jgi:hypothetical protein
MLNKMEKKHTKEEIKDLINLAHKNITRRKGKDYSPSVIEIQNWIDEYLSNESSKKTETKEITTLTEKHDAKQFEKFVKYAEKYLDSDVIIKNNKYKFCPKSHFYCYIAHREDKALFEIYRFYAKVFNVTKREIEDSFIQNKEFKNVVVKESMGAESGGSFEPSLSGSMVKRKINKIHNMDIDEITSSSSSGQYDVPFGSKGKNPLKIGGEKSIKQSRAVKDKNFPKWGGPKGVFIKVKEKCKKFPYCNQGDINSIEMLEYGELQEAIKSVSKKTGISYLNIEKIVLNEINKIFINNEKSIK